jgi:CHAT domain-containing protein
MKKLFALLSLLLALIAFSRIAQAQNPCSPDDLLTNPDLVFAERTIDNCGQGSMPALIEASLSRLEGDITPAERALAKTVLALAYARNRSFFEARLTIQEALADWRTAQDATKEPFVLFFAGEIFEAAGQNGDTWYGSALQIAERQRNTFIAGRVRLLYGKREWQANKAAAALGILQASLPLLLANPTIATPEIIENLNLLSQVQNKLEKYEVSRVYRSQAQWLGQNPNWYIEAVGTTVESACPYETLVNEVDILAVEHALPSCTRENATFTAEILDAIASTNDPAERARLQTLAGLLYYAASDFYNATVNHERALLKYREVSDRTGEGWTLFYMARAYYGRQQPGNALTYLGQSLRIAREQNDVFQVGRNNLLNARYELSVNNDNNKAALLLEEGLLALQGAGERAKPEQIATLELLNQVYTTLGNPEKAGNYLRLAKSLKGESVTADSNSSFVNVPGCVLTNLVNQFDVVFVERQLAQCGATTPGLMLTGKVMRYTSTDPRTAALGQLYYGIGQFYQGDYVATFAELDDAILLLRQVGDPNLTATAYYYYAMNAFHSDRPANRVNEPFHSPLVASSGPRNNSQAATYFEEARKLWARINDNFNLGRVAMQVGIWESRKGNYTGAVRILDAEALANLQASPVYSINEQREVLTELVYIYRQHLQQPVREQEFTQQLATLGQQRVVAATPTPAESAATTEETVAAPQTDAAAAAEAVCNISAIVSQEDLVVAERQLAVCPSQWEDLLFQVTSKREQATDSLQIAFYQNFLGIIHYYMGNYPAAVTEHNRAMFRYREAGEAVNEARSTFYSGRSYLAQNKMADANTFLSQAQRIARNADDPRVLAELGLLYGERAYLANDVDEALKQYLIAIENLEKLNDAEKLIPAILFVAQIQDERSNFEAAVEQYNRAATLAEELGDSTNFVRAKVSLARWHKYFGRYAEAEAEANAALEAANTPVARVLAQLELADVARLREDYTAADNVLALNPVDYDCVTGDLIRLYKGYYYISTGSSANALQQFRPFFAESTCPQRSGLTIAHARAGIAEAQLLRRQSDQFVLDAINAALRDYDALNYPRGYMSARIQLATLYFFQRNYTEAERWLSTAQRKSVEVNDLKARSDIEMLRVEMDIERGLYNNALQKLETASDLYNQLAFVPGLSSTVEQRLRIFLDQARYEEATDVIEFAKENYANISISFDSRIAYYEGRYQQQIGQTELAITYYDQALNGFNSANEVLSAVDVQLQKARILLQRGQYGQVETLLNQLRVIATNEENDFYLGQIDEVAGDNLVASWAANANRTSSDEVVNRARATYERSLASYTKVQNVAGQARVNNSLAELELQRIETSFYEEKRYRGSSEPAQRALGLFRIIGNSLGASDALYNIGRFFFLTGDYTNAEAYFGNALREVGNNDPLRRSRILTYLGLTYEGKHLARGLGFGAPSNDLFVAVNYYTQATELLSFAYAEISDEDTQRRFGTRDEALVPYNRLLRIYAIYTMQDRTADATRALFFAEQSRARSYLTQLQGVNIDLGNSEESQTLEEWRTLRDEVINLNKVLQEVNARSGDNAETQTISADISAKLARMQELEQQLDLSSLQQFVGINVTDLPKLQAALPENTAMVSYYLLPAEKSALGDEAARLLILIISRDSIEKFGQRIPDFQQDIINQLNAFFSRYDDQASNRLYRNIVAPIADSLARYENLIIVPHNVLNYIPFEALLDNNREPLVTRYNISYVPSATVYTLLRDTVKPADPEGIVLGLGYSGLAQNLPPLTYYVDELYSIVNTVPTAIIYEEDDAVEERLTNLSDVEVIHFAAHGVFDSANPLMSYVALAPNGSSDGLLRVSEIYQLSLKDQNPLITLSACELAVSQVNPGDELEGMTRAFLLTGARGVIASLWRVDDFVTSELMQVFYQSRASGMTNSQALAEAKRYIRDLYGSPDLWAGFVLVGLES